MDYLKVDKIRRRIIHSISQYTADQAGPDVNGRWMQQADIQQFVAGKFLPADPQLTRLAYYLGVPLK